MEKLSLEKIPPMNPARQPACRHDGRRTRSAARAVLLSWLASLAPLAGANAAEAANSANAADAGPPAIDAASVEAWADATFAPAYERKEFSGLVVSAISEGRMIFSKGYGRHDFAADAPVDPATTQFRIGSITKTFTASLLAKLIVDGRIASLDDPANRYLQDYRLPDNDGVAITLHHLVTHTAGFEDRFYAIGARAPVAARLAAAEFDKLRPAYVRPAGARIEYSNFGIAVVGRIIEDVTGLPIDVAMREMLFEPLGMDHTRLLVDIDEPADLGKPATIHADGSLHPTPFTAIHPAVASAGSIVATGNDMARYMLAQLHPIGDEAADTPAVLPAAALELLHDRRAGNAPETTGVGVVFFDENWGQWRTIAHGGNWAGFHNWMVLLPGQRAGLFIGVMSEGVPPAPLRAVRELFAPASAGPRSPAVVSGWVYTQSFLNHFLGERRALPAESLAHDPAVTDGWYMPDRRVFASAEAVADLVSLGAGALRVETRDGALTLGGAGGWRHAGDGVFILDAPNRPRIVIRDDPRVDASVLIPDLGIYTLTRIAAHMNPRLHAKVVLVAAGLAALAWLLLAFAARTARRSGFAGATLTALIACALPVLAGAKLYGGRSMLEMLYVGANWPLALFVLLANLLAVMALLTLWRALRGTAQTHLSRSLQGLIGLCGLAVAVVLAAYNVLGWNIPG